MNCGGVEHRDGQITLTDQETRFRAAQDRAVRAFTPYCAFNVARHSRMRSGPNPALNQLIENDGVQAFALARRRRDGGDGVRRQAPVQSDRDTSAISSGSNGSVREPKAATARPSRPMRILWKFQAGTAA